MITNDELELLKGISVKDIKKYRPDLFSDNKKEKTYTEKEMPSKTSNGSKDRASFLFVFLFFVTEIALLLGVMFYDFELLPDDRLIHYLALTWGMSVLWCCLPDGKLKKSGQIIVFSIIPLCEFVIVQLLGICDLWGLLFLFVYAVFLIIKYDLDFARFDTKAELQEQNVLEDDKKRRRKKNMKTIIILIGIFFLLGIFGVLIYYAGNYVFAILIILALMKAGIMK